MTVDNLVQRALLRIRVGNPFFAALLLYAKIVPKPGMGTAATDGTHIFFDPSFFLNLPKGGIEAVLVHEVLHCALQHLPRRGTRHPALWNYAADIVVNGIISEDGRYQLPMGAVRNTELEVFSVEEIYRILARKGAKPPQELVLDIVSGAISESVDPSHWSRALRQARMIAASAGYFAGVHNATIDREEKATEQARINWQAELWRFLVRTPFDFANFDRRFIHTGTYLEGLVGESVSCLVVIDTSGSIDDSDLKEFLAELDGILASYPHVTCNLFYADSKLYGPYVLSSVSEYPRPKGGGGTSFVPIFKYLEATPSPFENAVCIYLTDGYGVFPEVVPSLPVIWVVPAGGLPESSFPFGDVVRLL